MSQYLLSEAKIHIAAIVDTTDSLCNA